MSCATFDGFRNVSIPFAADHEAQPYGSSRSGSPPTQCVSTNVPALVRDHLAHSAIMSQSPDERSAGVMYISCSCVPVPK